VSLAETSTDNPQTGVIIIKDTKRKGRSIDAYQKTVKMWQGFDIINEVDLAIYLDNFRILFAYNSNKIENNNTTYVDTYEVFANDRVCGYTGDTRTIPEIRATKAWQTQKPGARIGLTAKEGTCKSGCFLLGTCPYVSE